MTKNKKTKLNLNKHIHLYKRINLVPSYKVKSGAKSYLVLRCQKPDCNHSLALNLALGKLCECNVCHNPMVLDKETVRKALPRCQSCIVRRTKPEIDLLNELINTLENE